MIDPKELRIGNCIDSTRVGGRKFAISPDDFYFILMLPENYDPIELTPECLERAGFESDGLNKYYWHKNYSQLYLLLTDRNTILPELWRDSNDDDMYGVELRIEIKHVHQLQNLFFCLCGTELEFKL